MTLAITFTLAVIGWTGLIAISTVNFKLQRRIAELEGME